MALLSPTVVAAAGIRVDNVLAAATGGGDTFLPADDVSLVVNNGGGGAITVTVTTHQTSRGLAIADAPAAVSVAAGQRWEFGPFPAELYADPTDGLADIAYSGVTSVTVGVFKRQRF
jgi:hypothetical protein